MDIESKTEILANRKACEFTKMEKAYHSYKYTLQSRNQMMSIGEYSRINRINRDTLRGWLLRYPCGRPFYDADLQDHEVDTQEGDSWDLVRISPDRISEEIHGIEEVRDSSVRISFFGCEISADAGNLETVLAAIRNVSSGQDR